MIFGLTFEKMLLIGVIAALLIGPERLPRYAESFARIVRRVGEYLRDAKGRVREEMGPEIDEVDWRKLDPRQYDPRRIIRDALFDDGAAPVATATATAAPVVAERPVPAFAGGKSRPEFGRDNPPPYDSEAT